MRRRRRRKKMNTKRDRQILQFAEKNVDSKNIAKMYGITESRVNQIINEKEKKVTKSEFESLDIRIRKILRNNRITNKEQLVEVLKSDKGLCLYGIGKRSGTKIEEVIGMKLIMEQDEAHRVTWRLSETEIIKEEPLQESKQADPTLEDLYRQKEELEKRIENMKGVGSGAFIAKQKGKDFYIEVKVKKGDEPIRTMPLIKTPTAMGLVNELHTVINDLTMLQTKIFNKWGIDEAEAAERGERI